MHLATEQDTAALARRIRPHLRVGDVLLLDGPVGAGKSAFARAMIQDAMAQNGGAIEPVPSPTFTLVQVYDTTVGTFWHTDLYRLGSTDELVELGLDQAFEEAISLVEWPERLGAETPERHLRIDFAYGDKDDARIVTLLPNGPGWDWITPMINSDQMT